MTKFSLYMVWPINGHSVNAVPVYGRSAKEAAEEAFLAFIDLEEPPESIALWCLREGSPDTCAQHETVFPSTHRPFTQAPDMPRLHFGRAA